MANENSGALDEGAHQAGFHEVDSASDRASLDSQSPNATTTSRPLRIGFLVHDVSRMRRTLYDQAVKPLGITRSQWWALTNLSRQQPNGMVQGELARLMDLGKVALGGLIDRLEAGGYVERRLDRSDRRLRRVFITERGYEVIADMTSVAEEINGVVLKGISPERVKIAEDVLSEMKDNLRAELEPPVKVRS